MWSMDSDYQRRVQLSWREHIVGTVMYKLMGKLNRLKTTLRALNRDKFDEVERKVD